MTKKKSQFQEDAEAKVIHKMKGKIDLKKLWEKEDQELDPSTVNPKNQH